MRVGVIGTGRHGSRYANHIFNDIESLELAAISRRSHEVADQGDLWNCSWYRDWRDMVADSQVEAVVAAVPPSMHLDIARVCVEKNKPLLIEKPLAVSTIAAREIVDLFASRKLPLTVGQTLRYNPVIQGLRQRLPSIGLLLGFSANQRLEPSTLAWHEDPDLAGAGVSFHTAVHVFDALRFITGLEVRRVMAVSRKHHSVVLEDLLAVLVEMEDNIVGTVDCSKVGNARSGRFEFVGQKGQLHGEQIYNTLEFVHGTERETLETGSPENTIVPLMEDWAGYLAGEAFNPIPPEEGLAAVKLCEACLESSRTGKWVEMN